ncbi:protein of unknown function [Cyanobium sp. NIES-981]|nr:protein of unknown function [Cyanobium sp. NIES-981]
MNLHMIEIHMESYITCVQEVVGKILLDDITFVATANNKLLDAEVTVRLQNMPEDGLTAYLHHRFWLQMCLFCQAGAEPTSKDDGFHQVPLKLVQSYKPTLAWLRAQEPPSANQFLYPRILTLLLIHGGCWLGPIGH